MAGKRGNPNWTKGVSGNPGGKSFAYSEMRALARTHTLASINALVRALRSPRTSIFAATALLDRGWGKPTPVDENGEERLAAATNITINLGALTHDQLRDLARLLAIAGIDQSPSVIEGSASETVPGEPD